MIYKLTHCPYFGRLLCSNWLNWCCVLHTFIQLFSLWSSGSSDSGKGDASDEDDENEFFDAMEDPSAFITVPADPKYHRSEPVVDVVAGLVNAQSLVSL